MQCLTPSLPKDLVKSYPQLFLPRRRLYKGVVRRTLRLHLKIGDAVRRHSWWECQLRAMIRLEPPARAIRFMLVHVQHSPTMRMWNLTSGKGTATLS